jgi:hypothetical protein
LGKLESIPALLLLLLLKLPDSKLLLKPARPSPSSPRMATTWRTKQPT